MFWNITCNTNTPSWYTLNSLPFVCSCSGIEEIHWAVCSVQALQLVYNIGGVQISLHIVLCFTGNQVPSPTVPLISQATQVPLKFLAVFFWTATQHWKAWHLICTAINDLEIQNPIHNLETPAARLFKLNNWFSFCSVPKTKWSFRSVMILFPSLVNAQFL